VLAGGSGWDDTIDATMAEVPSHLRVLRPGYLRFSDLPGYLGGAVLVAYPSHGEGFGLPVLEAMACGAPVLTTRRLSLPEVGGDAVAYTEPDPAAIAAALGACWTTPTGAPSWGRPGTSARCSSPGRPARRPTSLPSGARSSRERPSPTQHVSAPLRVVVVTYSPGTALADFLASLRTATRRPYEVVLADNGSDDGAPEAAAGPGVRLLPTGGNVGYGRAANLGRLGRRRRVAGGGQPRRGVVAGLARRAARRRRALAAGGLPRPGDPHAGRPALPVGPRVPVARARHRPRAVRLVVAGQPVDALVPRRGRHARRGHDRLAVRLLHAPAPRGVRGGRRLRPDLLHVLRGHGPVPPAGRGRLEQRLRAVVGHHPPRRPRHLARGRADAARAPPALFRYLSRQYAGPAYAPVRAALGLGLLLRYLLAARVRAVGEGAAPTRSADVLEESA
jgi:hypothetical protein